MYLFGDYHTHTIYSRHGHGKSTIMDNALVAKNKGLKQIGISDHGYNHKLFSVRRNQIFDIRKEIDAIKSFIDFDILLSIEANLISCDGDIDLNQNDFDKFDYVMCGFHRYVKFKSFKDKYKLLYKNIFNKIFKRKDEKQKEINTIAMLKMLDKYNINVITHLGCNFPVDVLRVAKKAVQKGTLIELNGKRINFTSYEIDEMVKMGVKFILNSDAHISKNVGEVDNGLALVIKNKIPLEQVVNLNKDISYFKKNIK